MKRILLMIVVGLLLVSCGGNRDLDKTKIERMVNQCLEIVNTDLMRPVYSAFEPRAYTIIQIGEPLLINETTAEVRVEAVREYSEDWKFVFQKNMDGDWVFAGASGWFIRNGMCNSVQYE